MRPARCECYTKKCRHPLPHRPYDPHTGELPSKPLLKLLGLDRCSLAAQVVVVSLDGTRSLLLCLHCTDDTLRVGKGVWVKGRAGVSR